MIASCALCLAACGGGSDDGDEQEPATSTPAETTDFTVAEQPPAIAKREDVLEACFKKVQGVAVDGYANNWDEAGGVTAHKPDELIPRLLVTLGDWPAKQLAALKACL